jgi:hypothetical protein
MPTPSEQKALAFVAIVVVLGGAVRVVRAGSAPQPSLMEQQALARQASSAESAAAASKPRKGQRGGSSRQRRGPQTVGGLEGAPPRFDRAGLLTTETGNNGFAPPGPRIDTDVRRGIIPPDGPGTPDRRGPAIGSPLDLDRATVEEIDRLPRVGPALARRIVASRDSAGPFGSLQGLERVKGIGAATLKQLAPLVTFSGRASSRP